MKKVKAFVLVNDEGQAVCLRLHNGKYMQIDPIQVIAPKKVRWRMATIKNLDLDTRVRWTGTGQITHEGRVKMFTKGVKVWVEEFKTPDITPGKGTLVLVPIKDLEVV